MSPEAALGERLEAEMLSKSTEHGRKTAGRPTVLLAIAHPEIRNGLAKLLQNYLVNTIWVDSVKDVKSALQKEKIAVCLSAFWLQDGTYRELVRHVRRERVEVPLIIVSEPECPEEFRDYVAAMNLDALNFLCYPYRKSDLDAIFDFGVAAECVPEYEEFPSAESALKSAKAA